MQTRKSKSWSLDLVETSKVTFMISFSYLRARWAADGILWAEIAFQIPTPLSPPTPSLLTIGWLFRSKSYRPSTFTYLVPPNYWELSLVPYFSANALIHELYFFWFSELIKEHGMVYSAKVLVLMEMQQKIWWTFCLVLRLLGNWSEL